MRGLFLIVAVLFCTDIAAQECKIAHCPVILKDTLRGNRKIPVEIFYPEMNINDHNAIAVRNNQRYPLIFFAHGYLMKGSDYKPICDILVPEGFILVFLNSETGLFPSHKVLAEDVSFAVDEITRLSLKRSFILFDKTDSKKCLMGHSMGGGSIFITANLKNNVDAIVALSPLKTKPSSVQAASSVEIPTLIIAGSNDCITPPGEHQVPIYNFSASHYKTYILISGGTHCQMGVTSSKCTTGEKMAGCKPAISRNDQYAVLARYLVPWLGYFLKGEKEEGVCFDLTLSADNTVTYMQSKPLSASAGKTQ